MSAVMKAVETAVETLARQVSSWTFVENSSFEFDLPKVQDIESLVVELAGTVTLSTGGTAVRAEAPLQLIPRLTFIADGKDVLDDAPMSFFAVANYHRSFWKSNTAPSAATAAAYAVRAVAYLDRELLKAWRPKDTTFQAWLTKLLQLKVTTGAGTDLFTGSPVGSFVGTVKVGVNSFEELVRSDGKEDKGEPKSVVRRTFQTLNYSAANSAQQFKLPVGNRIRLIEVHAQDNVNARSIGEPSNTLVNNIKFAVDGTDVRFNLPFVSSREKNAADLQVPIGDVPTGFAVIDAHKQGKLSGLYDLRPGKATEAVLELDLAAPTTLGRIEVMVEEIITG